MRSWDGSAFPWRLACMVKMLKTRRCGYDSAGSMMEMADTIANGERPGTGLMYGGTPLAGLVIDNEFLPNKFGIG